jgi:hypothetical protein
MDDDLVPNDPSVISRVELVDVSGNELSKRGTINFDARSSDTYVATMMPALRSAPIAEPTHSDQRQSGSIVTREPVALLSDPVSMHVLDWLTTESIVASNAGTSWRIDFLFRRTTPAWLRIEYRMRRR